jgi:hypothetical protein
MAKKKKRTLKKKHASKKHISKKRTSKKKLKPSYSPKPKSASAGSIMLADTVSPSPDPRTNSPKP